ncbi:MAG: copper resistance protein NlpE, partial [Cardiobacterium sp.]
MTKTLKPAGLLVAFLLTGCLGGGSTPTATTVPANSQTTPPPAAAASDPFKGTYNGVLPCADCDGLQTSLTLDGAGNYTIQSTKL